MGLDRSSAALLVGQADTPAAAAEAQAMADICLANGADFATASTDPIEADLLLEARRLHYRAAEASGTVLSEDVGVPRSRLTELLAGIGEVAEESGLAIATVGHAGDGNLHPAIIFPRGDEPAAARAQAAADDICRRALALGGTLSGEHGIGSAKRQWLPLQFDPATHAAHRLVKAAFDPIGILNPGRAI